MAYDRIDPIGDERLETMLAIVAQTVAATAGSKTKIKDFLPEYDRKPMTKAEFNAILKSCGIEKKKNAGN